MILRTFQSIHNLTTRFQPLFADSKVVRRFCIASYHAQISSICTCVRGCLSGYSRIVFGGWCSSDSVRVKLREKVIQSSNNHVPHSHDSSKVRKYLDSCYLERVEMISVRLQCSIHDSVLIAQKELKDRILFEIRPERNIRRTHLSFRVDVVYVRICMCVSVALETRVKPRTKKRHTPRNTNPHT